MTSIAYGTTGWIGNLIVRKDCRGRGIGEILTKCAIESLLSAGVSTIWLSATEAGRLIYQGLGFTAVDTINQWVGLGQARKPDNRSGMNIDKMLALDLTCWGDRRETLIDVISRPGMVIAGPDSFIVMKQWMHGIFQLGPWVGVESPFETMTELLEAALTQIGPSSPVFLYVPCLNVAAAVLLAMHGFSIKESNTLMCLGSDAAYVPRHIFGLASPGLG